MKPEFEKSKKKKSSIAKPTHRATISEDQVTENSSIIVEEMKWLEQLLDHRLDELDNSAAEHPFSQLPPVAITNGVAPYAVLVRELELGAAERLLLICTLIPHFAPEVLTNKMRDASHPLKVRYPELGGYIDSALRNFVPSLQTVLFLLAGKDRVNSVFYHLTLTEKSQLFKERIISLKPVSSSEDDTNMRNYAIAIVPEYVNYLISGDKPRPDFGKAFPATLVQTKMTWDDLILPPNTMKQVLEVMDWVKHGKQLLSMDAGGKINASFPCLFHGPPGTGKSLTAKLIGNTFGKDVFRIDLSMVVSKYIGETEKNLAHLFDTAEGKDWILFFDEADSLFSKRTDVNDSHDKWANLEVSYLLQRMEEYTGLTILASNLKQNLDPAMVRRFQAMIYFPRPEKDERLLLWEKSIPAPFSYADNISMEKLSIHPFSGANIANILKTACLQAVKADTQELNKKFLVQAIRKEYEKEGRTP